MPELPDITIYVEHLERRTVGATLRAVRVSQPNLLRTVLPAPQAAIGRTVVSVGRVGKRIVIGFEGDLAFVLHLMIAGRLHWSEGSESAESVRPRVSRKSLSAVFGFSSGVLTLTEAGTHKRASLHVVEGPDAMRALDPGGLEPLDSSPEDFAAALTRESHTLKRTLTDPRILSGVGNAYSDEILHAARLSPTQLARNLSPGEMTRLHEATQRVLREWIDRLRAESGDAFPEGVTAFRKGMAVHGRFGEPCPVCGSPVQRIVHAENETNYCARCQTGGRVLADRALSRLLKEDWPRRIEELEEGPAARAGARPPDSKL
ncbi:MAG: Fpg/Nei family DNA glycosylase [Candidatus Eiseniibacteriota bacterium]